jgi:hypothetical protein
MTLRARFPENAPVVAHRSQPLQPNMNTNAHATEKRIARKHFHDASYVGLDDRGTTHWWSIYAQAVVLVDGGDVETIRTSDDSNPIDSLTDWKAYVAAERGWRDCRIADSITDQLAEATR